MTMTQIFGSNIRTHRLHLLMTQEELGDKVGIQQSAVTKYENGKIQHVGLDTVEKFAEALGVDPVDLLTQKKENTPHDRQRESVL